MPGMQPLQLFIGHLCRHYLICTQGGGGRGSSCYSGASQRERSTLQQLDLIQRNQSLLLYRFNGPSQLLTTPRGSQRCTKTRGSSSHLAKAHILKQPQRMQFLKHNFAYYCYAPIDAFWEMGSWLRRNQDSLSQNASTLRNDNRNWILSIMLLANVKGKIGIFCACNCCKKIQLRCKWVLAPTVFHLISMAGVELFVL